MKLEQSFEVSAPLQRVWETLIDVERVAPCLPGATVTGRNDDGSYNGEFKVKIGPTSASYSGKLNMESVDEDSHHATMQAAGTDKRGQGGAKATIQSSVEEIDAGTTQVNVLTDYHITGRLARFGRGGMIEEISNRLLRDFATNLQTMLTGDWEGAAESAETAVVDGGTAGAATASPTADVGDGGAGVAAAGAGEAPQATQQPVDGASAAAAEGDASAAEVGAAADGPPVTQAGYQGSKGESGDPAHATEATHEPDAAGPARNAGADPDEDPFAPPVAAPPPSGTAAGNAPPPPSAPTTPPMTESKPLNGLSLVGGVIVGRVTDNPVPFIGGLVAILVALGLLRRRGRG